MPKHRDSAETAALDLTVHAMTIFLSKAGLRDRATEAIGSKAMAELDAGARRHERRTQR